MQLANALDEIRAAEAGQARGDSPIDRRHCLALVVVAWPPVRVVGQGEQLGVDAVVQRVGAAALEVGASAAIDQEGVVGEDVAAPDIRRAGSRRPTSTLFAACYACAPKPVLGFCATSVRAGKLWKGTRLR